MKSIKLIVQTLFYLVVLALLLSHAVTGGFSHDENQFIAAGQMLAYHGLIPYLNYPYTHMPYAVAFYALTAAVSNYDFLAGRIFTAVVWLLCTLLIVAIFRLISRKLTLLSKDGPSFPQLLWEFIIVGVFLNHPASRFVFGAALNHSLSTLFSLLALWIYIRGIGQKYFSNGAPFYSGICICLAALIRFNYASLIIVLLVLWLAYAFAARSSQYLRILVPHLGGLLMAAIPALGLMALAPNGFYYTNLVYIRLNTVYYQELLYRSNMSLASKITSFFSAVVHTPIDVLLYVVLIYTAIVSLIRFRQAGLHADAAGKSFIDLDKFAVSGFAFVLLLTAFAPTPTLAQYFFAPLPFLLIILAILGYELLELNWGAYALTLLTVIFALTTSTKIPNPLEQIILLSKPSQWTPIQVHDFAESLKQYATSGRILTLIPMVPLEAGYDIYPVLTNGPFSWRTSLLLTPQRRAKYDVVSPNELPQILAQTPPDAVLTGFEIPNAGFERNDEPDGLEMPLINYASEHGYKPIVFAPPFVEYELTLWVKPH